MQRLGIHLKGDLNIAETTEIASWAETLGIESVWTGERALGEKIAQGDAITKATAIALRTSKAVVGLSIINVQTRSPVLTALTMCSLDEVSRGRLRVCLAAAIPEWMRLQGLPNVSARGYLYDTIRIVRALIRRDEVNYDGEVLSLHRTMLDFHPVRRQIPIYVAAVGPKMLALAREVSDGVILTTDSSIPYVKWALKHLRLGGPNFDVATNLLVMMGQDSHVEDIGKRWLARYLSVPKVGQLLATHSGISLELVDQIQKDVQRGRVDMAAKLVTNDMLDLLSVTGPPGFCLDRIGEFIRAGVTLPIVAVDRELIRPTLSFLSSHL